MEFIEDIRNFLHLGGEVLWVILWTAICLWCLIIERLLFFKQNYPDLQANYIKRWDERTDKKSTFALFIRQELISQAFIQMNRGVSTIKMLIALCPLLGLLGTVTGMIHAFDVMSITGTGNARAIASGISNATITTMAGMVVAISGLYFFKLIEERVSDESHQLADLLKYH